jgi:predicted transcriptional regulator
MKKLTRKEEEVMKILWKLEKAFVKDIVDQYDEPKPHYNTVSSLVRLLQDKGIIGFHPVRKYLRIFSACFEGRIPQHIYETGG